MPSVNEFRLMRNPVNNYIETCSGRKLYLGEPKFQIGEIALSLSRICRFTGHLKPEIPFYSVAQHCVLVSYLSPNPKEGLFHDATESVISDISSPVKEMFPQIGIYEEFLYKSIAKQFGLPEVISDATHKADLEALTLEADKLMVGGGRDYECFEEYKYILKKGIVIEPLMPEQAHRLFLHRYEYLFG